MQRIADSLGTMVGSRPTGQTLGTPVAMPQYLPPEIDEWYVTITIRHKRTTFKFSLRELQKITNENINKAEICNTELDK